MHPRTFVANRLRHLYLEESRSDVERISRLILPRTTAIVATFYSELLAIPESARYLEHRMVEERLSVALAQWLHRLFLVSTENELAEFIDYQLRIGTVHARIRIPAGLVAYGATILRREICLAILETDWNVSEKSRCVIAASEVLDYIAMLIGDSHMHASLRHEREAQSLRNFMMGYEAAVECERARATLFDWARRTVEYLCLRVPTATATATELQALSSSQFGLWLVHKCELLGADPEVLHDLRDEVQEIDALVAAAAASQKGDGGSDRRECLATLDRRLSRAGWLLSSLAERILASEGAHDPLTRLLNRRYLHTILQREVDIANAMQCHFAILLIDVDHFKTVNDQFGHAAGDAVLQGVGALLLEQTRTSDFAFRYGGEEFLLVLTSVEEEDALRIAEGIRRSVEHRPFNLGDGAPTRVTVSIGVAISSGHPDYAGTLSRGDDALYEAKRCGRNRVSTMPPAELLPPSKHR